MDYAHTRVVVHCEVVRSLILSLEGSGGGRVVRSWSYEEELGGRTPDLCKTELGGHGPRLCEVEIGRVDLEVVRPGGRET